MKAFYNVSFKYSNDVYCANIAHGEKQAVEEYYNTHYEWALVKPASTYEVDTAKMKGMPIVEIAE